MNVKRDANGLTAQQRYYRRNREQCLARGRAYDKEHKQEHHDRSIRWQRGNPKKVRESQKRNRLKNLEKRLRYDHERYEKNKEVMLARHHTWYIKTIDERHRKAKEARERDREKVKAGQKRWREANKEHNKIRLKEWRTANQDKVKVQKERWNRENPERVRIHRRNTRMRYGDQIREYIKNYIKYQRDALVERLFSNCQGICYLCEQPMIRTEYELEVDHYIPTCLGGPNDESNFRLTHRLCNRQKNGKHPDEVKREDMLMARRAA